jgi:DNA-binding LacI/PurR family transcriptional regulator
VFESCRTQDDRVLPELDAALFGSGPRVRFCIRENGCPDADAVRFDQVGGGRQATQHLLEAGHTRIAVLALHTPAGGHIWSRERTTGWREAMRQAGLPADDSSVIMPPGVADIAVGDDGRPLAARAAAELVQRQEITAVVAVTDEAARALITCLQESGRSQDAWPAIVGFDDTETAAALGFTSLRQPWESLGQEAVALMSDRLSGTLAGPPVTRFIPLRLVNRMTSTQARYSLVSALLSASCC